MEKRNFARLDIHAKAFIHWGDKHMEVEVENISAKGAFVIAASQREINYEVAFTIDNTSIYDRKSKVVRVTDKGIGLEFEKNFLD
jgi:hypothetical protein